MARHELKYFIFLGLAILVYILIKVFSPRHFDWHVTLHRYDKNPFGAYVLNEVLKDLFPKDTVWHSHKTIYELYDTIDHPVNLLSVSSSFHPSDEDLAAMLCNIADGGSAFISAKYFDYTLLDTFSLAVETPYYYNNWNDPESDTVMLRFTHPTLSDDLAFLFPRTNTDDYFSHLDSTATVIAVNDKDYPITIHLPWGHGHLYLNSTPFTFTNAYMLPGNNPAFISRSLSLLPQNDLLWTEYYQSGRLESYSPLRFILSAEPLRWAYYLTVFALLTFMFFEAKRKQRIIPVIKPLTNTSLEFVTTIANLYYQNGDHKDIAHKKISYFLEHIRTRYWLDTSQVNRTFIRTLAGRSNHLYEDIEHLFKLIEQLEGQPAITALELITLNEAIEKFHRINPATTGM